MTLYLTLDQHKSLKVESATRGMTFSEIVLEALRGRCVQKFVTRHPVPFVDGQPVEDPHAPVPADR